MIKSIRLATVEKISEGDRSIRGLQLKKYQRDVSEVSEGDRSIRGRQLKNIRGARGGGGVREPQRGIAQLIKYD